MPACPCEGPPVLVLPQSEVFHPLSLAIHSPALVTTMSSAPRPLPRVGLTVTLPLRGLSPTIPGATTAVPEVLLSHCSGLLAHRSCPPKDTVLASAAVAYRESQPV